MLLHSLAANQIRECFTDLMVDRLLVEMGLSLFVDPPISLTAQEARAALRKTIIVPAINLHDRFMCAIDKFTVETYSSEDPNFMLNWDDVRCKNVGEGSTRLDLEKLRLDDSDDVIQQNLKFICAKFPALMVRKTQGSTFGRPGIVVKQELLVASRKPGQLSLEEGGSVLAEEDRGLMWLLFRKYISRRHARQQMRTVHR